MSNRRKPKPYTARPGAARPTLYHYTTVLHLPSILRTGWLTTTESNLSLTVEHAGPDVVWLTKTETGHGNGLLGAVDKMAVRFTVNPDPAHTHWWPIWSRAQGITREIYNALEKTSGGSAANWWVSTRPIPLSAVTSLTVHGVDKKPTLLVASA
jgi:hypothetical protein